MEKYNTLIVNLIGGSGIGKSTTASGLFYELKKERVDAELINEFAKQLVWQERYKTFEDQLYIFAKQHSKINPINGKVEVIITDSPLLISGIFTQDKIEKELILNKFNSYNNINFFLKRKHKFNPNGRLEQENGAIENDKKLEMFLKDNNIPYYSVEPSNEGIQDMIELIMNKIGKEYTKKKRIDLEENEIQALKDLLLYNQEDYKLLQILEKLR